MATLDGNLWEHNLCRVVVVDVTDDYSSPGPPLPTDCYPVLAEVLMPRYGLQAMLPYAALVQGYLYDWHERPGDDGAWTVGVVRSDLEV